MQTDHLSHKKTYSPKESGKSENKCLKIVHFPGPRENQRTFRAYKT